MPCTMSMLALPAVLLIAAVPHDDPPKEDPAATHVAIELRDGFRWITADGLPGHETGRFPNRHNPNTISSQRHQWRVQLTPEPRDEILPLGRHPFGVAVNGVPFDPGAAEYWRNDPESGWRHEALSGHIDLGTDAHNAHVQPTGAYHYHGIPTGLLQALEGGDETPGMTLLGWAADGFPIYGPRCHEDPDDPASPLRAMSSGWRLKAEARPAPPEGPGGAADGTYVQDWEYVDGHGDLDACNGRTGVTPEFPDSTYYYVLTEAFPFVPRCYRGTPDESFLRRSHGDRRQPPRGGRPGEGRPRRGRPPGRGDS